jgi:hypothetical protein
MSTLLGRNIFLKLAAIDRRALPIPTNPTNPRVSLGWQAYLGFALDIRLRPSAPAPPETGAWKYAFAKAALAAAKCCLALFIRMADNAS